ncbi:MAG: transposase [Planctomycetes bacterium]|nr:transposase [Planctomycetota bacterium]
MSKDKSRKKYTQEFKVHAVKLCQQPGMSVARVAADLEILEGSSVAASEPLFDDIKYFFYITNDGAGKESGTHFANKPSSSRDEIVAQANDRCDQENVIEQLKNGVNALRMPVGDLVSNWAYMVMASLAWTLKAWFALSLPEQGRWAERHGDEKRRVLRMEFKTFLNAFIRVPCQIIRAGRRIVYRLLAWNPWQNVFLRGVDAVRSMPPAPLYSMSLMPEQRPMPVPYPMRC